jgi:hypothetical protein
MTDQTTPERDRIVADAEEEEADEGAAAGDQFSYLTATRSTRVWVGALAQDD